MNLKNEKKYFSIAATILQYSILYIVYYVAFTDIGVPIEGFKWMIIVIYILNANSFGTKMFHSLKSFIFTTVIVLVTNLVVAAIVYAINKNYVLYILPSPLISILSAWMVKLLNKKREKRVKVQDSSRD